MLSLRCILLLPVFLFALQFTQTPTFTDAGGGNWTLSFGVDANTDVEVSIVRLRDSVVIRHLAAGVLGANAPAPLAANNLTQTLTWDGKDDFGKTVANPASLSARVRAGMSVRLVNLAAEELYAFNQGVLSLVADPDGSVYLLGKAGIGSIAASTYLRKYDATGNYLKTLYPPPPGLAADSVVTYGINVLPGGGWAPKTTQVSNDKGISPKITNALLNNGDAQILTMTGNGGILINSGLNKQVISKSGACTTPIQTLITGPARTTGGTFDQPPFGPHYVAASANPKYLYLSGWFYGTINSSYFLATADTTGFWADGQVLRLDVATGIASPWLKLDSVPVTASERAARLSTPLSACNFAATHGVAIDDSGHVFVCDRLHKRIGVYDTSASLLGSISCVAPDLVAVSKRTGAVYVLRRGSGFLILAKYSGWRNSPTQAASVQLTTSVISTGRYDPATPSLGVVETGNTTNVYVGYRTIGFQLYADNGASFSLIKDFSANIKGSLRFERIAVDRRNDKVYWTNGARSITANYAISNWKNPVPYIMTKGGTQGFDLDNPSPGPNGFLYGSPLFYPGYASFWVPVVRYTSDSLPAAANYANTQTNIISNGIYYEGGGDLGCNHRGVAVGWQGQVAVFDEYEHLLEFPDTGYTDTTFKGRALMTVTNPNTNYRVIMNCVKYDAAGNFYVGIKKRAADAFTPAGFASDDKFTSATGSVVKYAAGTTGTITGADARDVAGFTGAAKVYPQPFGLFAGDNSSMCNCRNTYFDVDPYGRLYIPNAASSQVYIADNAGNNIAVFGAYGNTDCRGSLSGPGQTQSTPEIPIGWSTSVGASEDFVYVADDLNGRIVRVQMDYALDNLPGVTEHSTVAEKAAAWKSFTAQALPNPFNPASTLRLNLPLTSRLHIGVYGADGRLVREIASGVFKAGAQIFTWAGDDAGGRKVSSGLYIYRIESDQKVRLVRTMLVK